MRMLMTLLCGLGATASQVAAQADAPAGKRYALVVGVGKYGSASLNDLQFAEADAADLAKVFKSDRYAGSEVTLLTTADGKDRPTAARVRAALKELLARQFGPQDVVIVGFSGHGVQIGKTFYFCPAGADVSDPATMVSVTELYDQLGACKAGYKLLLTDACRNDPGKALNLFPALTPDAAGAPQRLKPPENTVAFFSGKAGEKSYESPELGHGLFFHFVIEGLGGKADLDGDGKVQSPELTQYVRVKLAEHFKDKPKDYPRQNPVFQANNDAEPVLTVGPWDLGMKPLERVTRIPGPRSCEGAYILPSNLAVLISGQAGDKAGVVAWGLKARRQVAGPLQWRYGTFTAAPLDRRGERLVFAATDRSNEIQIVDASNQLRPLGRMVHPKGGIHSFAASPRGDVVAVGDDANAATVYALRGGGRVHTFEHNTHVNAVAFSPDGGRLAVGLKTGDIFIYDLATGGQVQSMPSKGGHEPWHPLEWGCSFARFVGPDTLMTFGANRLIWWDTRTGRQTTNLKLADHTPGGTEWSVDCTPDGRRVVIGWREGHVSVFDVEDGKPRQTGVWLKQHGNDPRVAISVDGTKAVSTTNDGTVVLYETAE